MTATSLDVEQVPSAERRPERAPAARLGWVDSVRGIGIVLVFYGHVLQKGVSPANHSAADQLRLVYSFHMPLFFMLAGFFFKPATNVVQRLRQLALRRLLPVAFFGLLLLPLWARGELSATVSWRHDTALMALKYLRGHPELNWPTWFLVCLCVCEAMAIFTLGAIRSAAGQLLFGCACVLLGVYFCNHSATPASGLAYTLGRTWFASEAVVALGFYAMGHSLFPLLRQLALSRRLAVAVFVVGAAVTVATYRLNPAAGDAVMMAARRQGQALPFLLTSLAGSVAAIALGVLLSGAGRLQSIGRNTLPLLGLNGLFFHYVNHKVAERWCFPDSPALVAVDTAVVTILSLLVCIPAVHLINKLVPQLVGKTTEHGPLLPALERR